MDIYIDVLFVINFVMDFLILYCTGKFMRNKTANIRMVLAAFTGSIYSVATVLFYEVNLLVSLLAKILLSICIVAIAYYTKTGGLRKLMKTVAVFYGVSFVFCGAIFGIMYITTTGGAIKNGTLYYYWNADWTLLVFGAIFAAIILWTLGAQIKAKFMRDNLIYKAQIEIGEKKANTTVFYDTGNQVKDPCTGKPVFIVEYKVIKDILPTWLCATLFDMNEKLAKDSHFYGNNPYIHTEHETDHLKLRFIPFSALGNAFGFIYAVEAGCVEIYMNGEIKKHKNAIVGIYNSRLNADGEYAAIMGSAFCEGVT